MRKLILVLAGAMVIVGLVMGGLKILGNSVEATVITVPQETVETLIPTIGTPEITPTVQAENSVLMPYVLPVQKPLTDGYSFKQTVDLSSGLPTALVIRLDDNQVLLSNWAGAISYQADDDPEKVFAPDRGVIYSYLGDVTTTWAHSGISIYGQRFFATSLDLYVRKNGENQTVGMAEATEKMQSLVGKTAYLCQTGSGTVALLSEYDATAPCPGKQLTLEIVAAAVVPHEDLEAYDAAILNINEWLTKQYPESGFEKLNKDNGWILRFCIGKLADQTSDGSAWYLYNRGVLGFVIRE